MSKVKKKKNKPSLKDLKAPDEFQVKMAGFTPFLERHGVKVIALLIVVILVLVGVYMGIRMINEKKVEASAAVQTQFEGILNAGSAGDKATVQSSIKALGTEKLNGKPYATAMEVAAGSALLNVSDYKGAAQHFENALKGLKADDPMRPIVLEAAFDALVRAGKYKDAQALLDKVPGNATPFVKANFHILKGDLFNPAVLPKTTRKAPAKAASEYSMAKKTLQSGLLQLNDYARFVLHTVQLRLFTVSAGG